MPTQDWGVYPDSLEEFTEVSSTYEGRHVTCTAAELISDGGVGVATKGSQCVFGIAGIMNGVGVCFNSGTTTDLIAIDTEGIWNLLVLAEDDGGASLVQGGEALYINTTSCIISKIRNNATQIPFGYALGQVNAGDDDVIAVKVHWDPISHWVLDQEMLYFGDARDVSIEWNETNLEMLPLVNDTGAFLIGNGTLSMDVQIFGDLAANYMLYDSSAGTLNIVNTTMDTTDMCLDIRVTMDAGQSEGSSAYMQTDLTGAAAGSVYGLGSWINTGADFTSTAAEIITPLECGVYSAAVNATLRVYFAGQYQAILAGAPGEICAMRWNTNQPILAWVMGGNDGSVGFSNGTTGDGVIGTIPLANTAGTGMMWVEVHATVS